MPWTKRFVPENQFAPMCRQLPTLIDAAQNGYGVGSEWTCADCGSVFRIVVTGIRTTEAVWAIVTKDGPRRINESDTYAYDDFQFLASGNARCDKISGSDLDRLSEDI